MNSSGKHKALPSLSTKLLMLSGFILLLLSLSFTWLNTHTQQTELRDVFTKQATALAFNLAVSSNSHLLEKDLAVIEQLLLETNSFKDLYSAAVTNREGRILAQVMRSATDNQLHTQYNAERLVFSGYQIEDTRLYENSRLLTVLEPIGAGERIGSVVLEYDLQAQHLREAKLIQRNIGLAIVLISLAGLSLWLFMRRSLTELKRVTEFAQGIATHEGSQLNVSSSSRELALLQETLNWTSQTLAIRNNKLTQALEKADKSNELKSQFVANMSHEMRTPLNGILGLTNISLENAEIDGKTREKLQLIHFSAEHLLRVVNDILDFSKIDADKLDIEPHPFSLRDQLHAMFETACNAHDKSKVTCSLNIDPHLPDRFIGDIARILQVINNLLSNALKFTDQGEVSLTVQLEQLEPKSEHQQATLRFIVKDSGIGISNKAHDDIFKAFSQAEPGTARKYGGTGLGLTITQRLLRLMGSQIHLQSTEGVGSEFSFSLKLPCAPSPRKETSEHVSKHSPVKSDENIGKIGATPAVRVLVAEDNMVNQAFIGHVLTQLGVAHRFAEDGEQAIHLVDQHPFDLVFMDMHMPKIGGLEACKTILAKSSHAKLPIVGLTADAISDTRTACLQAGMKDYVSKPFKRADIEQALKQVGLIITPIPLQNFDNDPATLRACIQEYLSEMPALDQQPAPPTDQAQRKACINALNQIAEMATRIGDLSFAQSIDAMKTNMESQERTTPEAWTNLKRNLDVFINRLESLRG